MNLFPTRFLNFSKVNVFESNASTFYKLCTCSYKTHFSDIPNFHNEDGITKFVAGLSKSVKEGIACNTYGKMHFVKLFLDLSYVVIDCLYLHFLGVFTEGFLWDYGKAVFEITQGNQILRNDTLANIFPKNATVSLVHGVRATLKLFAL